jgi:non-specific serine/threonine protein kinase
MNRRQLSEARTLLAHLVQLCGEASVRWLMPRILEAAAEFGAPSNPRRAAQLGGAADAMRERSGLSIRPSDASRRARWLPHAEAQLGHRFRIAWEAGRLLDQEHALEAAANIAQVAERRANTEARRSLSQREGQVARLLARRMSNRAIAQALALSEATVRVHVTHVLAKLGVRSRTQVAARMVGNQDSG